MLPCANLGSVAVASRSQIWNDQPTWRFLSSVFVISSQDIPGWWVGGYYVNPIQWTIQGLVSSQLGDQDDKFIAVGDTTMTVAQYVREQFSYR